MELYRLKQLCKLKSTMPHMFQIKIVLLNTHFSEKKCSIWRFHFLQRNMHCVITKTWGKKVKYGIWYLFALIYSFGFQNK